MRTLLGKYRFSERHRLSKEGAVFRQCKQRYYPFNIDRRYEVCNYQCFSRAAQDNIISTCANTSMPCVVVGVLALQGGFHEHLDLLRKAASNIDTDTFQFTEVRTAEQLAASQALIIPGGESTAISIAAAGAGLLKPLREFVK